MSYKEDYDELREAFLEYKKKKYFEIFSSADIFAIYDDKGNRVLLTFIEQFFQDTFGIQLFYTRDGINYVHDILSSKDEYAITIGDCDSIVCVYKKRKDLTKDDIEFLNLMKMKIVNENNIILYRFQKGYRYRTCTKKEVSIMSLYGVFLSSLIQNEKEQILETFRNGDAVLANLNTERHEYSCIFRPLPFLEENPRKSPCNLPFVEEYKNKPYINDDCYLYTSYLPVSVLETRVRPLLLYFYFAKSDNMQLKYIIEEPKEYKNVIYGILDDLFNSVGMPCKMVINNRDLYYILTKTLDKLNIENVFERDNLKAGEDVSSVISKIYSKTLDQEMESEETITMLMDMISDAVNNIDEEDKEYNLEEDNTFVS